MSAVLSCGANMSASPSSKVRVSHCAEAQTRPPVTPHRFSVFLPKGRNAISVIPKDPPLPLHAHGMRDAAQGEISGFLFWKTELTG